MCCRMRMDLAGTDQSQWWDLKVKGWVPSAYALSITLAPAFKLMDTTLSAWAPRQLHWCLRLETLSSENSVLCSPYGSDRKNNRENCQKRSINLHRSPNCTGLKGRRVNFLYLLAQYDHLYPDFSIRLAKGSILTSGNQLSFLWKKWEKRLRVDKQSTSSALKRNGFSSWSCNLPAERCGRQSNP